MLDLGTMSAVKNYVKKLLSAIDTTVSWNDVEDKPNIVKSVNNTEPDDNGNVNTILSDATTMNIEWDGNIDGKDMMMYNNSKYYKVSDDIFDFNMLRSVMTILETTGDKHTDIKEGVGCFRAGDSIIVTDHNNCYLESKGNTNSIVQNPPSAGIYFLYVMNWKYTNHAEYKIVNGDATCIHLKSASGKTYKISVNDSGELLVVEVTE